MSSRSTPWACTCSTTSGSRRWCRFARQAGAGSHSSSPLRCALSAGRARRSTRSRSSEMLHLRVYGPSHALTEVGSGLEEAGAARNVALAQGVRAGHVLLTAEVLPESADAVLAYLIRRGVTAEDIALARLDEITPVASDHAATSLIWADVLGQ